LGATGKNCFLRELTVSDPSGSTTGKSCLPGYFGGGGKFLHRSGML
jgi:hypothetical protein